jgi:hypothetical protein
MNKFVKNRKQLLDLEHKNVFTITGLLCKHF